MVAAVATRDADSIAIKTVMNRRRLFDAIACSQQPVGARVLFSSIAQIARPAKTLRGAS
jgi:hypothetical protein